jgi:ferredoxin
MKPFLISIDGRPVEVTAGMTVLEAARKLAIDVPTLCYLEKCGPLTSCLVCLVKLNDKLVPSCGTQVAPGMVVESETAQVHDARRTALELLFSDHVGDCLSPCHRLCPLQLNIPVMIRQIESGKLDEAIVTVRRALPLPAVLGRLCHHPCEQGCRRGTWDDPAAIREMERVVADTDLAQPTAYLLPAKPASGKTVFVVGAGPTGLAAAYFLAHEGHLVRVLDRRARAGGSLLDVEPRLLPPAALAAELAQLSRLGITFDPGVAVGTTVTVDDLRHQGDAVLLAVGELAASEGAALGVPLAGAALKTDPNTCQTPVSRVFAAGSAVRPIKLVRAMNEGRLAAECLSQFLAGQPVRRTDKPFSSIMGRLLPEELTLFLRGANQIAKVAPCETCAGLNRCEAALEATRCLHCDCRSSGHCALQFYAQVYGADAGRYRAQRRKFEQQAQPGGVRFEPGKCILCGICVTLTELAAEPLGLVFIGRGFDVRLATPFDRTIEEGLQKVAADCVEHCPTGALVFAGRPATGTTDGQ